ncbi:MAG: hypothetical protein LUF87_06785 [Alistipes sp.]|nr:hypothetical protein [Alistipes sp.]
MKKLILLAVLPLFCLLACSDDKDEIREFSIGRESVNIYDGYQALILFEKGNKDYTMAVSGAEYFETNLDKGIGDHGGLSILGIKPGSGTVTITDNVARQTCTLLVTVSEAGLLLDCLRVETAVYGLDDPQAVEAIEKELADRFFFRSGEIYLMPREGDLLRMTGTDSYDSYPFEETSVEPYDIKFTVIDGNEPREFNLAVESEYLYGLEFYIDFFGHGQRTRANMPSPQGYRILAIEDLTGEYAARYPGIGSVLIGYHFTLSLAAYPEVD